ncbi:hypothetical protein LV469_02830 [Peptoniphilus sp. GNH]|nr:hypothetical protein LV469_02830 [Peptoniphilus sp. GNH]
MKIDKDIRAVRVSNADILRIIYRGGVLWESLATYEVYSVKPVWDKVEVSIDSMEGYQDTSIYNRGGREYHITEDGYFEIPDLYIEDRFPKYWLTSGYHSKYLGYIERMYAKPIFYKAMEVGKQKDKLISRTTAKKGTYPDNGVKDGFWYVRVK